MMMKTPLLAIGSVLIASLLGAIAPFLFEHGSKQLQGRVVDFVLNPYIRVQIRWIGPGSVPDLRIDLYLGRDHRVAEARLPNRADSRGRHGAPHGRDRVHELVDFLRQEFIECRAASSRIFTIGSSHCRCSGFMSTDRRQVTVSEFASMSGT